MILFDVLKNALEGKGNKNNILLGNGFNISLGIDTSYKSLFKSLVRSKSVSDLINDEFSTIMKKNNYNFELLIKKSGIEEEACKLILDKFYGILLKKCQKPIYEYNELIKFLCKFNNYFTTNYDPLLYRYLLARKEQSDVTEDEFYKDLKKVHSGSTSFGGSGFQSIPLKAVPKKQIYETANKIFKKNNLHKDKKMKDYYDCLRKIRQEQELVVYDGFYINPEKEDEKNYKTWDYKKNGKQNIFYLHGALNIFSPLENNQVRKLTLKKGSRNQGFINEILEQFESEAYSCIFSSTSEEKFEKIKKNKYLSRCLEALKESTDLLVIIGWSASECDRHLIDAIKESEIKEIYISSYQENEKFKNRFKNEFAKKKIYFFDISTLPFVKKPKNNKKSAKSFSKN